MVYTPENPLIVQSDRTIMLEVNNPRFTEARDFLARFAELVKSPEHVHTYRITSLSLWNAASSGLQAQDIIQGLEQFSRYELPRNVCRDIQDEMARYGRIKLVKENEQLVLVSEDKLLIKEIWNSKSVKPFLVEQLSDSKILIDDKARGHVKQALIRLGFPVEDLAGYITGTPLTLSLRKTTTDKRPFALRDYQRQAIAAFHAGGGPQGGSGVVVLPCGAGKTIVGIAAIDKLQCETLIITTNVVAVRQWKEELLNKTTLAENQIGEYSGDKKQVRPVTITTYQMLTYRRSKVDDFPHFEIFNKKNWGLIIYDEVHLLPAPVFRITAEIQARRRLGLTATLVREDGLEEDVFSLVGPKKYDVPWKELEQQGWIAAAVCHEIRIPLNAETRSLYAVASKRARFRIAAENPLKLRVVEKLLERHRDDNVLIIGHYLGQLRKLARHIQAPVITGQVPNEERQRLYRAFREGEIKVLVVSKVANFSIDLPDANVAIQVSGTFGSRQEEAQRLGRILRPSGRDNTAYFYSLVTKDSREQDFAVNRQLFLTEQGYRYRIVDYEDYMDRG